MMRWVRTRLLVVAVGLLSGMWSGNDVGALVLASVYEKCATVNSSTGVVTRIASEDAVCSVGASMPYKLLQLSMLAFATEATATYAQADSKTGVESIKAGTVDLAVTSAVLTARDYADVPDLKLFPAMGSAIVPLVHIVDLEAVDGTLVLSRAVLPLIFSGDIYEWTNAQILALQTTAVRNVLLAMTDPSIRVVVRDGPSGSTEIFSRALGVFSPAFAARVNSMGAPTVDWCEDGDAGVCRGDHGECEGISWELTSGYGTSGEVTCNKTAHGGRLWTYTRGLYTTGVVAAVLSLDGSIGYVASRSAAVPGAREARVVNHAGRTVTATATTVSYAVLELGGSLDRETNTADLVDATSDLAYPIVGYSYFVVRSGSDGNTSVIDPAKTGDMFACPERLRAVEFLEWFYSSNTVSIIADALAFTTLPKFISKRLVEEILEVMWCYDADLGAARTVKTPDAVEKRYLYVTAMAEPVAEVISLVYREVDPEVEWEYVVSDERRIYDAVPVGDDDRYGLDQSIKIGYLDQSDDVEAIRHIFAAPFFILGVVAQFHVGQTETLDLSLENLAAIYTGEITRWSELDPALPDTTITLVVRTDPVDTTDIFTYRLGETWPPFAEAFGVTHEFNTSILDTLGVSYIAVESEAEVEAMISYHDGTLGLVASTADTGSSVASLLLEDGSKLEFSTASLQACQTDNAVISWISEDYSLPSLVYDLAASTSDACWPFARAYAILLDEQILGPDQCEPTDKVRGSGPSKATQLARWIFETDIVEAWEQLNLSPPSTLDRTVALDSINAYPDDVCDPAESTSQPKVNLILYLCVGALVVLFLLCCFGCYMKRYQDRIRRAAEVLPSDVQHVLNYVFKEVHDNDGGEVANYIPELAAADPTPLAIVLVDLKGKVYRCGEYAKHFTIQSACKPLLYMLAITDRTQHVVDQKVSNEPTGQPFNAISFDERSRAFNPYVNAGAIMTSSMILGDTADDRFMRVMKLFDEMSYGDGRNDLHMDHEVYDSEMATCVQNRLIVAEAIRRGKIETDENAEIALDSYIMACSLSVTCESVALVAATMANNGLNPVTKRKTIDAPIVNQTVATMMTCGMYNGAGAWMVEAGVPAKSGVGGILMCVVPGVCGFATFSPRLDHNGNSTRGVLVAKTISKELGLHILHQGAPPKRSAPPAPKGKAAKIQPAGTAPKKVSAARPVSGAEEGKGH